MLFYKQNTIINKKNINNKCILFLHEMVLSVEKMHSAMEKNTFMLCSKNCITVSERKAY